MKPADDMTDGQKIVADVLGWYPPSSGPTQQYADALAIIADTILRSPVIAVCGTPDCSTAALARRIITYAEEQGRYKRAAAETAARSLC